MKAEEIWDNPNEYKDDIYKLIVKAYIDLSTCRTYFDLNGVTSYSEGINETIFEIRKYLLPK